MKLIGIEEHCLTPAVRDAWHAIAPPNPFLQPPCHRHGSLCARKWVATDPRHALSEGQVLATE